MTSTTVDPIIESVVRSSPLGGFALSLSGRLPVVLARVSIVFVSLYLPFAAWTLSPADRAVLGIHWLDALLVTVTPVVAGAAFLTSVRSRTLAAWVVATVFCALGRALDLALIGSVDLAAWSRYRAAAAHLGIFLLAQLSAVVLVADRLIFDRT